MQGPSVDTRPRYDHGLQRRWREEALPRMPPHADVVADPDVGEPPQPADATGRHGVLTHIGTSVEDADGSDPPLGTAVAEKDPVADTERSREHPRIGHLLPRRSPLDLEDRAGERPRRIAPGGRKQVLDAFDQLRHPGARDGRTEEHRMRPGTPGLLQKCGVQPVVGHRVLHVRGQQLVVVFGEDVEQPPREGGVVGVVRSDVRGPRADPVRPPHGNDRRGQPAGQRLECAAVLRAAAVDLVDEHERGDAQPPQGPHQHACLRLHALHGRHDQHRTVEHTQHPLHLGDEVRVTRGVDQVDGDVVQREGDDGRLDGDAALPLQRERVGQGAAVVDAADFVDHPGRVQEPLGEARLTGSTSAQDSQVQRVHEASCPSEWGWFLAGWTWTLCAFRLLWVDDSSRAVDQRPLGTAKD